MTLEEIKAAVLAGHTVCHHNPAYEVRHHDGDFSIVCTFNGYSIGLTWLDGVTMNGKPEEFYIHKRADVQALDAPPSYIYSVEYRGKQIAGGLHKAEVLKTCRKFFDANPHARRVKVYEDHDTGVRAWWISKAEASRAA